MIIRWGIEQMEPLVLSRRTGAIFLLSLLIITASILHVILDKVNNGRGFNPDELSSSWGLDFSEGARGDTNNNPLVYSSFLGGSGLDMINAIATDSDGYTYVAGQTGSGDFPVTPGTFNSNTSWGAFVCKITPKGDSLVFSTIIGKGACYGIAVDWLGNIYVTGDTESKEFPMTMTEPHVPYRGDVFVTKLTPDGSSIVFSVVFGGGGHDIANAIALDAEGNMFVAGYTESGAFPTTPNAFQTEYGGGWMDAFVCKLDREGSIVYSTFLGGSKDDTGSDIAVDASGYAYITGNTWTGDFPLTENAIQHRFGGGQSDAFICKLDPDGSGLLYSTLLGGKDRDRGYGIDVDNEGAAYVSGLTESDDFPVTPMAFQGVYKGGNDGFACKLNPDGTSLIYCTFIGGKSWDWAPSIIVDDLGCSHIVGSTGSEDFPITADAYQDSWAGNGSDIFILKLNPKGHDIVYSTFFGTNVSEQHPCLAIDEEGRIHIGCQAWPSNLTTPSVFQPIFGGGQTDSLVFKFEKLKDPPPEERSYEGIIALGIVLVLIFLILLTVLFVRKSRPVTAYEDLSD
jgi:hypothetical protein